MNLPAISVVMSVFNGQAFLAEAIESILAQTYRNYEFVIIDDGSTDRTAETLAAYASRDERIRVHRHENRGRAESLNLGIGVARGEYIARMDADDIALPHRFIEQVEFMEHHPEVGLLSGTYEQISAEGRLLGMTRLPLEDEGIRAAMLTHCAICHPAVMMRKDVVIAAGGYRKVLLDADDYDLWLRMSERTQMANLEQPLLRYRIHANQMSIANATHQTLCVIAARTAAALRRQGKEDPLSRVEEITPEFLSGLGVRTDEVQKALLVAYCNWIEVVGSSDSEAGLRLVKGFLQVADSRCIDRAALANAWLKVAELHYRQGRLARALLNAARAVCVRPLVAGRPIKRAFDRLAARLRK